MLLKLEKSVLGFSVLLFSILALFLGRVFNLNFVFGLPRVNNYIDFVFQLADLIIVILAIFQVYKNKLFLFRFRSIFWLLPLLFLGLIFNFSLLGAWHFLLVFARIICWIFLLFETYNSELPNKNWLFLILITTSFFDHFLLSSSLPVFIIYLWWQSRKSFLLLLSLVFWYILNFFTAVLQILRGQSLGLSLLGEPKLDLQTIGIAKQVVFEHLFLRGYGFALHPNILGFVGLIGLFFSLNSEPKIKLPDSWFGSKNYFLNVLNKYLNLGLIIIFLTLILLSFSRLALIGLIILLLSKIATRLDLKAKLASYIGIFFAIGCLFLVGISRFFSSDFYRFADLEKYFSVYQNLSLLSKLFGVGLGNYSFYLKNNLGNLQPWQWQPVHNIWFNLFIEFGIVPLVLICLIIVHRSKKL